MLPVVQYRIKSINKRGVLLDVLDAEDKVLIRDLRSQLRFNAEGKFDFEYLHTLIDTSYRRQISEERLKVLEKKQPGPPKSRGRPGSRRNIDRGHKK